MILNDVLTRQNVFTKIVLKDGDKELSKSLKVKIMRIRMAYTKIKKAFDEEVKEFTEELVPQELKDLNAKTDRTEAENARIEELTNKVNMEYQEFLIQKGNEEVKDLIDDSLTMDEYSDILDVNSGNDIEINGNKIQAVDFLEIIYDLFVKE
jgi:predicted house-cleaning noncanonical NTP pyrophosphatase (MazG superfamily)